MTASRRSFLGALAVPFLARRLPAAAPAPTPIGGDPKPKMPAELGSPSDAKFWTRLRGEFSIPRDEVFFNTGTLGSSPRVVQEATIAHMRHVDRDIAQWDYKADHEQYFTGYFPERGVRDALASVIHCSGADIALCQNATFGMNFVANGLDFARGDEVVVLATAHPGGRKGYDLRAKRDGIVVKEFTLPEPVPSAKTIIDAYLGATTARTKVWAIPHISSSRMIRFPVRELCALARDRGIFSAVDGAQSVGHLAVDVREIGCDAFFASPHKWMLAPKGTGFLYVRPERQRELWATLASSAWDDQTDPMYRLMQYGTGNLSLLKGLEVAVAFHQQIGSAAIEQRIVGLADRLRAGLATIPGAFILSPTADPTLRSAGTVYGIKGKTGAQIQDTLWASKIRVRAVGADAVRHTCHLYNADEDVDRTLALLRGMTA